MRLETEIPIEGVVSAESGHSKRSPHERRKSDVSDLRKLTMAELGNTRVLRKCGIFLRVDHPD
jgi:hypothetical protein